MFSFLSNFQFANCRNKSNVFTSCFYKVIHCIYCTDKIVRNYFITINVICNPIKHYNWGIIIDHFLQMRKIIFQNGFFCQRKNKTIYNSVGKHFYRFYFFGIRLIGNTRNDFISSIICYFFNAFKNLSKEII